MITKNLYEKDSPLGKIVLKSILTFCNVFQLFCKVF